jgi:hypothetical protein
MLQKSTSYLCATFRPCVDRIYQPWEQCDSPSLRCLYSTKLLAHLSSTPVVGTLASDRKDGAWGLKTDWSSRQSLRSYERRLQSSSPFRRFSVTWRRNTFLYIWNLRSGRTDNPPIFQFVKTSVALWYFQGQKEYLTAVYAILITNLLHNAFICY